jgi:hypothetical protein
MNMEIAGHEWFSADGKTVWYDLQTPRGEDFWVAGYEIATGKRTWLHLDRNAWSVHFNTSPDGKLFAGDGGDSEMVAHAPDGKWLYLMRPRAIPTSPASTPRLRGPDPAGRAGHRAAGQHEGPRLPAGAERQLHARRQVDRVPLQHARGQPRLCGGGGQGGS